MIIEYKIDKNDYLTHQLYIASKSERIKKKRMKNKVVVPLIYAIFGLLLLWIDKLGMAIIFFAVGILWYFIYPIWEKRHYIKHYEGFIKENYRDTVDRTASLEFSNEYIIAKDSGSESKVLTKELKKIDEISTAIFVRLKTGQAFVLPKDKIKNIDLLIMKLKELAKFLDIEYNLEDNWKWK